MGGRIKTRWEKDKARVRCAKLVDILTAISIVSKRLAKHLLIVERHRMTIRGVHLNGSGQSCSVWQ